MKLDIQELVRRVAGFDRGRIVLCNILDGVSHGLYDRAFVRTVFNWWLGLLVYRIKAYYSKGLGRKDLEREILETFDQLLLAPPLADFRPGHTRPEFLCQCKLTDTSSVPNQAVTTIMPARRFLFYLISPSTRRKLAGDGSITMAREPGATEVDIFLRNDHKSLALKTDANFGKPGGVLWICPQRAFSTVLSTAKPADRGRDCLGLIHYPQNNALVAIYFALGDLGTAAGKRPTFADAGSHRRFRTLADQEDHRSQSSWGFTVDLEPLAVDKANIDGLPERICLPVSNNDINKVDVMALGHTTLSRGDTRSDNDKAFAQRISARHGDDAQLRSEIMELLR